jgi:hypothetical protein
VAVGNGSKSVGVGVGGGVGVIVGVSEGVGVLTVGVSDGVRVWVGVLVTHQTPLPVLQSLIGSPPHDGSQPAVVPCWQDGPAHTQQSIVGLNVAVGVRVGGVPVTVGGAVGVFATQLM